MSGSTEWLVCKVGCIECGVIEEPALRIIGVYPDEQQAVAVARDAARTIAKRWGMTNPEEPYAVRATETLGSRLGAGWMWTPADHEQVYAVRLAAGLPATPG
ncbi:hypothetical protein UG55_100783 [Frankia sp. EI5c]|uniref:hypothetical protein n=1 Tax=Frankia sp. EI5c TaxID=683316 RepID=UPI0007C362CF|nr:hypothetical protein [Frankia sp. EI5c]OAA27755.1 hypothetical protein UG55_100783 [Frankia sp. EI5c]